MKRVAMAPFRGHNEYLFYILSDPETLKLAHKRASKGKHKYSVVKYWDEHLDECCEILSNDLRNKTYCVWGYHVFEKPERGKIRLIHSLKYYKDRVVQWAIILTIYPYISKQFTKDTYSAIPGKGQINCMINILNAVITDPEGCKYYLKTDIHHYYQSINHNSLKNTYRMYFKDKDLLWLIDLIIDSIDTVKGIPIGSLVSQYSGNLYLSQFDHYIKEIVGVKHYFRYMDDMVIFYDNKIELHRIREIIQNTLKECYGLELKNNYQIYNLKKENIDFVGYVVSCNGRVRVRRSTKIRYARGCVGCCKYPSEHNVASCESRNGLVMHAHTYMLQKTYIDRIRVTINKKKRIIKTLNNYIDKHLKYNKKGNVQ